MKKVKVKLPQELIYPHPYILKSKIIEIDEGIKDGDEVLIINEKNKIIGTGFYNSSSYKTLRIHTYREFKELTYEEIKKRIEKAFLNRLLYFDRNESFRVVFSESDFLTGLIIDKFSDGFVFQINSLGMERKRDLIVKSLKELFNPLFIYEKSDGTGRKEEGLPEFKKLHFGNLKNPYLIFTEGLYFLIDIEEGQKTGFFLDQKINRLKLGKYAKGKICLDLFSYTGGFTLHFLKEEAERVFVVEISEKAISLLKENIRINNFPEKKVKIIEGDVFEKIYEIENWKIKFDLIVNDPPSFTHKKRKKENALRAYKELHSKIFDILNKGGICATFSCTQAVGINDLIENLTGVQKNKEFLIYIKDFLFQSPCHPVSLYFPESFYLKGLVLLKE
ncbi:MAG: class I SAM-dependent rRNA methyltransferase [candidate division WOR-3 bacterium]